MEGAMWMQALLLMPYLVLASSFLLVIAVVSICSAQGPARRPSAAAFAHFDRRIRSASELPASGVDRRESRHGHARSDGAYRAPHAFRVRRSHA